eukprot:scaffold3369_cov166-Amphora_coffeaeformis.AAC.5
MNAKQRRAVPSKNCSTHKAAALPTTADAVRTSDDDGSKDFRWSLGRQLSFAKFVVLLLALWLCLILVVLPRLSRTHEQHRAVRTTLTPAAQKTCTCALSMEERKKEESST